MQQMDATALQQLVLTPRCYLALVIPVAPTLRGASQAKRRAAVHDVVRSILARLASRGPDSLRIARTERGKPYLEGADAIQFNISHAHSHSLLAFSRGASIGCDIEDRFSDDDVTKLGPLVLHPAEVEAIGQLPVQERPAAFRRNWVRKEAVLKAVGAGLLDDPRGLLTGFEEMSASSASHGGARYQIHNRRIDAGCEAAVACAELACDWRVLAA